MGERLSAEYTAGFLDGEAAIVLVREQTIRITVAQVDLAVLEALQETWGGSVRMRKDGVVREGRRAAGVRRRVWAWNVSSWEAVDLLVACLPYLIVKRADTREVLEGWLVWQRSKSKAQMPPSFYAELREAGVEPNIWRMLGGREVRRREQIRRRTVWLAKLVEVEVALDGLARLAATE